MELIYTLRNPVAFLGAALMCAAFFVAETLPRSETVHERPGPVMHVSFAAPPEAQPAPPQPPPPPAHPTHPRTPAPETPPQTQPSPIVSPTAAPVARETPAAPPFSNGPNKAQIEASYVATVRERIEQEKIYPTSREARIQRPQGAVTCWFVLARSGALADAGIERSAGSILDRQALVTVRRGRYAPFPEEAWAGESEHRFTVELQFIPM